MTKNRPLYRALLLTLSALIAAASLGCGDGSTGSTTKEEPKTAPPPPNRVQKAPGKGKAPMNMPHL